MNIQAPIMATLIAFCIPYCEIGGGEAENSVTVPGEDGVYVKAEVTKPLPCKIEMERSTRKVVSRGEVSYVFDKSLTEQELRLRVGKDNIFKLAGHDEASGFKKHLLEVSPEGERVAYKLDDSPWQVVYAPSPEFAVHAKPTYTKLDWAKIPKLKDTFLAVYEAQSMKFDGKFSFQKKPQMLAWLKATKGEAAVVPMMIELLELKSDTTYRELVQSLSAKGRAALGREILALLPTTKNPRMFEEGWRYGFVDLDAPENLGLIQRGLKLMTASEDWMVETESAGDAFLRAYARQAPAPAAEFACQLRSGEQAFPLKKGRPLHVSTLAATVAAGMPCDAAETLTYPTCHNYHLCNGKVCSKDELTKLAKAQLQKNALYTDKSWVIEEELAAKLAIGNHIASGKYDATMKNCP